MRLHSIKLSGFKSFVEPTHFQLPGQLVGVVGPNGCGKSNIIDAVRWVLGESKASELRGESMQDVIFNGTNLRKPAGRASVELAFDNSEARAGGPWNRFAEIAVKRVLTRDGTSSYHINGQPVRRRDVQDVFLGTGLGPRAYAIIGQGTISRIIESKPEELRLFLEEAAGVSKYKERRRETEARLKDTRENLTRVEDILRELTGNLDKLEAQAEVAGHYRALQNDAQLKTHQLWFLRHRDAAREEARVAQAVVAAIAALDAKTSELRRAEAELEQIRQSHYGANDALHAAQGVLGQAALEVSRLEERIRYVAAGRERLVRQRADLEAQSAGWRAREADAMAEHARLGGEIDAAERAGEAIGVELAGDAERLGAFEAALRDAQSLSSAQRGAVAAVQQQIQVSAAEARGVDERLGQAETRRDRLVGEEKALVAIEPGELGAAQRGAADAEAKHKTSLAAVADGQARVPALEEERKSLQDLVNDEARRHAELGARLAALQALQEKVQVENKLKPWLSRHGLDSLAGLWTRIRIEPGWEAALEAALRERLGALEIGRLDTVRAFAADAPPARLAFFTAPGANYAPSHRTLPRLADLLHLGDAGLAALLADWLEGVYTASDFDAALAARSTLTHGEVIMTREGHAVSQFAVSFYAPDSEQAGLLARAQEIENLQRQTRAQALVSEESKSRLVRAEAASTDAAAHLAESQREAARLQSEAHRQHLELVRLMQLVEQTSQRREQLGGERSALESELAELAARKREGETRFDALDAELGIAQEHHAELDEATLAASAALDAARDEHRAQERRLQEAQFELRSLAARRQELERQAETAREQLHANLAADAALGEEHAQLTDEPAQAELQAALAARLDHEQRLGEKRSLYDDLSQRLRGADEVRLGLEQSLQPLRDKVGALQLEQQAAQLGGAQYAEQLDAAGVDRDKIAASIEEGGVKLAGLQGRIDALQREIEALGAVNLAALEELGQARERKDFLDAQNADLGEAMATLEDAIRKIDLETRELLQTTFDQVNEHFGRMFPTLFGGGTARLVMTGDEILDAGVQVMAQPPGKRNSSIHLLSGGEKALAAIALVFAIFQLNPAPFCLLDEVDAPLDDANTERYAKLVTEMAKATQFLFISHNRIAMEMAEQLIGVTMQEQGVSRIVTVDMPGAMKLAEAA
ncbi:MAG TPA: chromosome segregation protein SMC [Caldimonas sp.]|jgi:chromosome segregation protein